MIAWPFWRGPSFCKLALAFLWHWSDWLSSGEWREREKERLGYPYSKHIPLTYSLWGAGHRATNGFSQPSDSWSIFHWASSQAWQHPAQVGFVLKAPWTKSPGHQNGEVSPSRSMLAGAEEWFRRAAPRFKGQGGRLANHCVGWELYYKAMANHVYYDIHYVIINWNSIIIYIYIIYTDIVYTNYT